MKMLRRYCQRKMRGFTILEVLIAAVLMALIVGAIYFFTIQFNKQLVLGNFYMVLQNDARLTMERLSKNITIARGLVSGSDSAVLKVETPSIDSNGDVYINNDGSIKYYDEIWYFKTRRL